MDRKTLGTLTLLGAGFLFGLSAVLAKYLTGIMLPFAAIEFRFLVALITVGLLVLVLSRKVSYQGLDKKLLVLYAISFPGSVVFITLAIYHGTATLATAAAYGTILVVSFLLGRLFLEEKITKRKQAAFILVILAIFIFTDPLGDFKFTLELLFAVICGIFNASGLLTQRMLSQQHADRLSLLILQCSTGSILAICFLFFQEAPLSIEASLSTVLLTITFGVTSLGIVYLTLVGFKYIPLNTGSILTSSQLFFAPLLAALFLSEKVGLNVIIGGGLILLATILANVEPKTRKDNSAPSVRKKIQDRGNGS